MDTGMISLWVLSHVSVELFRLLRVQDPGYSGSYGITRAKVSETERRCGLATGRKYGFTGRDTVVLC
jgi:hypothetical protein